MEKDTNTSSYVRPKTRGELHALLKSGEPCEVATSNVEITTLMLKGWLEHLDFDVRLSENEGWSVFYLKESSDGQ